MWPLLKDLSARPPYFDMDVAHTCDFGLKITKSSLASFLLIIDSVRIAAVQQILPHLTSADNATTARPNLDQPVISSLPSLYCLRHPLDITLDTSNKSVLKV